MTMTCPKCGGSGKGWVDYGRDSSAAPHETICNSCGGLGYVTDNIPQLTVNIKTAVTSRLPIPSLKKKRNRIKV